uniref:Uncharacterized protein n=1 Tax=Arundo donax TaxID=35708 RepID=A0A0A9CB39_ARUDO
MGLTQSASSLSCGNIRLVHGLPFLFSFGLCVFLVLL